MLKSERLSNGLKVLLHPQPFTNRVCIGVAVHTGSRNDKPEVLGLHHFAEHTPFRGTKNFPTKFELTEPVERYYGKIHAQTDLSKTDYRVELPIEQFDLGASLVSDLVFQPLTRPEDLEQEREVVLEEGEGNRFDPDKVFVEMMLERMFAGSSLAQGPIGKVKTIKNVNVDHMVNMYSSEYTVENADVIITGRIPDDVISRLENSFGKLSVPHGKETKHPDQPPACEGQEWRVEHELFGKSYVQIGRFVPQLDIREEQALRFFLAMLSENFSSPLFLEMRERRQLYYGSGISVDDFVPGMTWIVFQCQTNKKKIRTVVDAYWETVFSTFRNERRFYFARDRRRAKLKAYEPRPHDLYDDISDEVHMGEWVGMEELLSITDSLTLDEVEATARKYFDDAGSYTLIGYR